MQRVSTQQHQQEDEAQERDYLDYAQNEATLAKLREESQNIQKRFNLSSQQYSEFDRKEDDLRGCFDNLNKILKQNQSSPENNGLLPN